MIASMQDIRQHKKFRPKGLIYGFLGKHPQIADHRYRGQHFSDHNRSTVLKLLGSSHSSLALLNQVHGSTCANIKSAEDINYNLQGDAQVTMDNSIILAVQTAD